MVVSIAGVVLPRVDANNVTDKARDLAFEQHVVASNNVLVFRSRFVRLVNRCASPQDRRAPPQRDCREGEKKQKKKKKIF